MTCIREGRGLRRAGRLQLHVYEILFQAYRAAETGCAQDLETTLTPWHTVALEVYDSRGEWV